MKIITEGIKDGDFRFNCKKCLCVFDANAQDDNFLAEEETEKRQTIPFECNDEGRRHYKVYDVKTTVVKCKCPSCEEDVFSTKKDYKYVTEFCPAIFGEPDFSRWNRTDLQDLVRIHNG